MILKHNLYPEALVYTNTGQKAKFSNYLFTTTDRSLAAALKKSSKDIVEVRTKRPAKEES